MTTPTHAIESIPADPDRLASGAPRPSWLALDKIEHEAYLILFRGLAERIPVGHRFANWIECAQWCEHTAEAYLGWNLRIASRAQRVANTMMDEIAKAGLDTKPGEHSELLLRAAIRAQREYRKNGFHRAEG